jgi:acetyltransferase-like isoleucine patch superfamily enzyme
MINHNKHLKSLLKDKKIGKFKLKDTIFSTLANPKNHTILFAKKITKGDLKKLNKLSSAIIILQKKCLKIKSKIIQIENRSPKLFFFKILKKIYINKKTAIKPLIGKNTSIHESTVFGNNITIGKNTVILANVVIGDNVVIGNNCYIKSNTTIGQKGFGFTLKNKKLDPITHYGSVIIKNNVEIGSNNTVVSGTLDSTTINSNTKLDDHVHIAHNCNIGANNLICAGAIFGGSVSTGKNNFFGLNSTIRNGIQIGNDNLIGANSYIAKNLKGNSVFSGSPARYIRRIKGLFDKSI